MDHRKQVGIVRELLSHIDNRTTSRTAAVVSNSSSAYTSPEVLRLEHERIFHSQPLVAALSCDLPEPGSFVAEEAAGTAFLLVRGRDGRVRAFLNACRHRGTRLVLEPRGRRLRFSCPFHAWTYEADGRLVGVPLRESFGECDTGALGLIALPVAEKYGIVWLKARPGAEFDIDDDLGGLGPELAGWELGGQFALGAEPMPRPMNWKLANDTFGETYHFAMLHRNTLSAHYHGNVAAYETFGRNHRMVFAARSIDELRGKPQSEWRLKPHSTIAYYLFPNTQLLVARQSIAMYRIFPVADQPSRCLIYQSVYLDREPSTESELANKKRVLDLLETVIVGEDFVAAASAQAALSSGALREVVYGRNEPALHHYHANFREALGR
jgi:carnitine monooxygenase subunit